MADDTTAIATDEQNAALEHTDEGAPETTRDDALDQGVPMLPGDGREPVGPEDALGVGQTRGDYRTRMDSSRHLESVPNPNAGAPVYAYVKDGKRLDDDATEKQRAGADRTVVDYEPAFILVDQSARLDEIGNDEPTEKGGVTTAPTDREAEANPSVEQTS